MKDKIHNILTQISTLPLTCESKHVRFITGDEYWLDILINKYTGSGIELVMFKAQCKNILHNNDCLIDIETSTKKENKIQISLKIFH